MHRSFFAVLPRVLLFAALLSLLSGCAAGGTYVSRTYSAALSEDDRLGSCGRDNALLAVSLKDDGRFHSASSPQWGRMRLMRKGGKVYRQAGTREPVVLHTIRTEGASPRRLEEYHALVGDIDADGRPEFFFPDTGDTAGAFYRLTDAEGNEPSRLFGVNEFPGLFGFPHFDATTRVLTVWEKSGPYWAETVFMHVDGLYRRSYHAVPVPIRGDALFRRLLGDGMTRGVLYKVLVYDEGRLHKEYLSAYGETRALIWTAGEDVLLLEAPTAEEPAQAGREYALQGYSDARWGTVRPDARPGVIGRVRSGESLEVIDIRQEPDAENAAWLCLAGRDGRRGWVKVL